MGAINIPAALKQMDGIFGCKVSLDCDKQTEILEYRFAKKTIVDWVVEFFSKEKKADQNVDVMIALWNISQDISDADDGGFKKIVTKYAENNNLIDFKEIRRTLRSSLTLNFPPVLYERTGKKCQKDHEEVNDVKDYKKMYLANLKKSILAETEVQIYRDKPDNQVSDVNLEGFAEALVEFEKKSINKEPVYIDEKNAAIQQRFEKKLTEVESRPTPHTVSKPKSQNDVVIVASYPEPDKLSARLEKFEVSEKSAESEKPEKPEKLKEPVRRLQQKKLPNFIEGTLAKGPSLLTEKKNLLRNKLLDGGRLPDWKSSDKVMLLQDWVDIYQTRLTETTFVIDGVATVYCEHDGSISEGNLKAFCFALLTLDNNDELPSSVYGGSEYNDAWIYFTLLKTDSECAERVKARMQLFNGEVMAAKFSEEFSDAEANGVLVSIKPFMDKEEWINFYDDKYKAGNFLKDGVAQIVRGTDGDVSAANLEAFCEILMHLSASKVNFSINEDSESMRTQIYLALYDRDLIRPELRPVNN